ncbi:8-amino-7-oxononanoate synthase-like [Prunus avium]|uniref:8-amino-7-oxononanoate synthase-like n=1 Tax=Prunus avium TaxID=42229 RepID=A0A6P5T807_PRUAV|nr:8-amino-7-oxononanoate synthase-like [Prunus avium]
MMSSWDHWVEEALQQLEHLQLLMTMIPIYLHHGATQEAQKKPIEDELDVFDEMQPWDRSSVEVHISEPKFIERPRGIPVLGDEEGTKKFKRLLLFSGNDYLGLGSHPTIGKAASKAALEHGMGPRGSALICGYTDYHRRLESGLADLKNKEDCLLCPTGFAANVALMVALGSVGSLSAAGKTPLTHEKVAIFSDALNHASIIDGIRLAQRQKSVEIFIYRHCDMTHLNELLSSCTIRKKAVVTDSLFSMDGDFAPMIELVKLRKEHNFLLVIDDAHGTFVCGKNGGGVAEEYHCEKDVDICVGTLSKAAGCHGGFIACSKNWKQLIQSRGRSFMFSTAMPVPIAAAAHAALIVARKETWRRRAIWNRVQDFRALTGIPINSHIISLIVGSEEKAEQATESLLKSGFHVIGIAPPVVPPNSCRLRVTLSATHTRDDIEKITVALSRCVNFQEIRINGSNGYARL